MHSPEGRGGLGETGDRLVSTAQGAAGEVAPTAGYQARPSAPRMSDAASREEASLPTHATSRLEGPGLAPSDRGTPGHEF